MKGKQLKLWEEIPVQLNWDKLAKSLEKDFLKKLGLLKPIK